MNKFQKLAVKMAKDESKYMDRKNFKRMFGDITFKNMVRLNYRILVERRFTYEQAVRFRMFCQSMNEELFK